LAFEPFVVSPDAVQNPAALLVPDAEGDLVASALGAQGGEGGAEDLGHLGFGDFVAGDAVGELFGC